MLTVINGSQHEPVLESNYEKLEELNGASLQIAFNSFSFAQNVGHELIDFNVLIEDEDGHQYKVKQLINTPHSKQVVATHIYYELIGYRKHDSYAGTRNFNSFATWLFNGSGWTFINDGITDVLTFYNFGNDNFLQLVQRLIAKFDVEMTILPGKRIRFAKRIGADNDKQYRFKHNIKEISQSIDTTNVRTRIVAYGENGLTVTYTSPLAQNPLFGVLEAEPVTDSNINNLEQLLELARRSLNDAPNTNIEASVIDVDGNVGDVVWVIHEEMNLEYQTRILSKRTKRDYEESMVEIGNVKKRTIEDALIDQKEEILENEVKTNEKFEEVEEEIEQTTSTLRAEIIQTENAIRLEVEEVDRSVSFLEVRADQIQSSVTNLENYTSSSITQLSDNINLKIDKGGAITDINLSPGVATINAEKINLNGAVMVNGSISGATDINTNRNVSVGNALYFGGTQGSIDYINIAGGGMTFSSTSFYFSGSGNMYINGKRVLTTDDL